VSGEDAAMLSDSRGTVLVPDCFMGFGGLVANLQSAPVGVLWWWCVLRAVCDALSAVCDVLSAIRSF
jgi:hypothetical protein